MVLIIWVQSHFYRQSNRNIWERGGTNWEIRMDIYTLLSIKYITNKDLLYSTGNSTQYSVMTYIGKESKKEWIYVYV